MERIPRAKGKPNMQKLTIAFGLAACVGAIAMWGYLIATTKAHSEPLPRACIDRADFVDALPRVDSLARLLDQSARLATTAGDDLRGIAYKRAAEYMRISSRLLALSSWSCK
jgi:hypothetical protein